MDLGQIQTRWDELLLIIGAIGMACEGTIAALLVLVGSLRGLAGWLAMLAMQTGTATDDRSIASVIRGLDAAAAWLERAQRWIPRLRTGVGRKPVDPRGTAAIGLLLALGVGLAGCGGSDVRRHVIAAEALDGVIVSDATVMESRVREVVIARVRAECPEAPDGWLECVDRVAEEEAERFERWGETHNAFVAARDAYVAGVRARAADQSLRELLDEAVELASQLATMARAYGVDLDLAALEGLQ